MPLSPSMAKLFGRLASTETRIVYAWERPSIMRKHIYTGAMGMVYLVLFYGMYLVSFGNDHLEMRYWQWGLLSALSSFALMLQMVSAHMVSRIRSRRTLWFLSALVSRLLRAIAIALTFWLVGPAPALARWVFIALLVLSNGFSAMCVPPWFSWLADIIPQKDHGRFMGRRTAWIALANLVVVLPLGWGIDRVPEQHKASAMLVIFGFAFVVGIVDLFIHSTIPEPPMPKMERKRFWKAVIVPFRDPSYRPWLLFNACWTFGMTLGGVMTTLYMVDNLGMKHNFLGASLVLILLPRSAAILFGKSVGALVDRHGVKQMLRFGHTLWAVLPLFWFFATPASALAWIGTGALIGGLASTAALNAAGKLVTRLPERQHVAMYVAVSTCVGNFAGGLGGMAAGLFLQFLKDFTWSFGGRTLIAFHILFITSLALRLASTVLLGRIQEPPERPDEEEAE